MKTTDALPNWNSLTKQEQARLKEIAPLMFANKKSLAAKKVSKSEVDLNGSDHISRAELNREYRKEDEDPLSQTSGLPSTER